MQNDKLSEYELNTLNYIYDNKYSEEELQKMWKGARKEQRMSKEYLPDKEKRILLSALSHEMKLVKDNNLTELIPVVKNLDYKFIYDRLFKQIENKAYQQGAKEFAELLKKKFNEFIDYDDNGEQTFESNPDLVWIAIDEVLAEWQKGQQGMNEEMQFPNTFEEFISDYSFKDREEVYTNGCELIPTFRVMQGYEHFSKQIRADAIAEVIKLYEEFQPKLATNVYEFGERLRQMQKGAENE